MFITRSIHVMQILIKNNAQLVDFNDICCEVDGEVIELSLIFYTFILQLPDLHASFYNLCNENPLKEKIAEHYSKDCEYHVLDSHSKIATKETLSGKRNSVLNVNTKPSESNNMNGSHTIYTNLTKNESLAKYVRHVTQIRKQANANSVTGVEFDDFLFIRYLNSETERNTLYSTKAKQFLRLLVRKRRKFLSYACIVCTIICLVVYRNETSNLFMKNIQNYIYPLMSVWRLLTLPIIKVFPGLTELYDESCLVSNPFFQVKDLDCRPCAGVINVLDLSTVPHNTDNVPHIFKTNQSTVDIKALNEIYMNHLDVFVNDANRVQSTNRNIKTLKDLFTDFMNDTHQLESHTLWRCNRMNPAQILRQIVPKPKRLPTSGMSIERYLAFDTASAPPYRIPDVDCSSIFIIQLKGTRTILLRPTAECKQKCRTISVRLPQSYVLNYNWWYWKPISLPDHITKQPSISYIGAFC